MRKSLLLNLICLLPLLALAQDKWEGGIFLGYSNYLGDMVEPAFTLNHSNPAAGIFLRNHLSPNLSLRGNLFYGKLEGADANYESLASRGAEFSTSLVEVSLLGEYELFGKRRWSEAGLFKRTLSPYVFTGVGLGFFSPDVNLAQDRPSPGKAEDLVADYSNTHFALPVGGGIKVDLNRRINLGVEFGMRFTFSDYIDGIAQGGDPDDNDVYFFGGLAAGFSLAKADTDGDGVVDADDPCPTIPGPPSLRGCPDSDGDGIADRDDTCPNEAGEVRLRGCPDRDGDGIADNVDDCPDDAGLRRFSGCPDTDKDGIVDKEDNCPTQPGIPSMNGCPDADRDGIADDDDDCPNEPGPSTMNGCPDTDGDGVSDADDACPRTPGPVSMKGCPDSDGDGIADPDDKCPLAAGPKSNSGCPEILDNDKKTLADAMRNVRFESGSARLVGTSLQVLDQVAELMTRYPGYRLSIDGYTDSQGNDFANQQLSEQRAQACFDYLVSRGVNPSVMGYNGHGESNPVATNDTADGRRLNRRVEFNLLPQ